MSKTVTERIKDKAFGLLKDNPDGLNFTDLVTLISESDEKLNRNTINSSIRTIVLQYPKKIYKPSRGLFRLVEFKDPETDELKKEVQPEETKKIKEEDFYEPFSNWLQNDIEEATQAIPLGGNRFKGKWGTPDVIGKRESKKSDIIKAPVEIVSAEIKADTSQLIMAFGQACAYMLFSHKCYLVIPKQSSQTEIARLDSLCQILGIGLVLFNAENPNTPDFIVRVRPIKHEPDFFYTNKYMSEIEEDLFK